MSWGYANLAGVPGELNNRLRQLAVLLRRVLWYEWPALRTATPGQVLANDGTGVLSWATAAGGAAWATVEVDLGATPVHAGRFTITDAAIGPTSRVLVRQAAGPYTGKGTLADEADMDQLVCTVSPGSGSAVVRWRTVGGVVLAPAPGVGFRVQVTRPLNDTPVLLPRRWGRVRGNVKFDYLVA